MDIYFACSITGGRKDEEVYQEIVKALTAAGHEVLTAELADSLIIHDERSVDPKDVYLRDTKWMQQCDFLVAEISTPSHGVGYEIGYALDLGKPVICLHKAGRPVSKMILGNQDKNLSIISYQNVDDAVTHIINRLDESF
jgi:nucleoside 2-deoxyribosyltransferase